MYICLALTLDNLNLKFTHLFLNRIFKFNCNRHRIILNNITKDIKQFKINIKTLSKELIRRISLEKYICNNERLKLLKWIDCSVTKILVLLSLNI